METSKDILRRIDTVQKTFSETQGRLLAMKENIKSQCESLGLAEGTDWDNLDEAAVQAILDEVEAREEKANKKVESISNWLSTVESNI